MTWLGPASLRFVDLNMAIIALEIRELYNAALECDVSVG
jgi:hypothetical protein